MSELVEVPFKHHETTEQAILLLAAAEELDLGSGVVRTREGAFLVPPEVRDKAFAEPPKTPAKTAAKSTTPKKAQE